MRTPRKKDNSGSSIYDDAFRTMMNNCLHLVIPVINEIFGKHYTGRERIYLLPNEHYINRQDGLEQKRITDSAFKIISEDGTEEKYIFECQSTPDNTMLVRIFEYITQEALDSGEIISNTLTVTISNSAVLFLRSNQNTPDIMKIVINTPGGTVKFDVPVMKMKNYSLDDIFGKGLYFLLPFYIFNFEKKFAVYEKDEKEFQTLKTEYENFMARLEEVLKNEKIYSFDWTTIMEMSRKVLEKIAKKYSILKEGVKNIMGGRVLEYPGSIVFNEGRLQGIAIGEGRGEQKNSFKVARKLRQLGINDAIICEATALSPEDLKSL